MSVSVMKNYKLKLVVRGRWDDCCCVVCLPPLTVTDQWDKISVDSYSYRTRTYSKFLHHKWWESVSSGQHHTEFWATLATLTLNCCRTCFPGACGPVAPAPSRCVLIYLCIYPMMSEGSSSLDLPESSYISDDDWRGKLPGYLNLPIYPMMSERSS
jgi:hypothetical protein